MDCLSLHLTDFPLTNFTTSHIHTVAFVLESNQFSPFPMFAIPDYLHHIKQLQEEGYHYVPIKVPAFPSLVDVYALLVCIPIVALSVVVWCVLTAFLLPTLLLVPTYSFFFTGRPLNRLEANSFYVLLALIFPFVLPVHIIGEIWWYFVFMYSFAVGLPVALLRLILGQYSIIKANFDLLSPYWRRGKYSYPDTVRCVMGISDRVGFTSFLIGSPFFGSLVSSLTMIPIAKYILIANPFLYELETVHINQWAPKLPELTLYQVKHRTQTKYGRSKHNIEERAVISTSRFIPHYPFGAYQGVSSAMPEGATDTVVGIQYLNLHPRLVAFTESTWARDQDKMKSQDGELPMFRVTLPYFGGHFLTGFVEVNFSKTGETEHPMWCIVPKHAKLGRDCYEFANILFLPFLKEARYLTQIIRDDEVRDSKIKEYAQRRASLGSISAVSNEKSHTHRNSAQLVPIDSENTESKV